jgi:hypothetical protein
MAAQGPSDVKIFSSVRPLQIQRSFESSTDEESTTTTTTTNSSEVSVHEASTMSSVTIVASSGVPAAQPQQQPSTSAAETAPGQSQVVINAGASRPVGQSTIVITSGSATGPAQNKVLINTTAGGATVQSGQHQVAQPTAQVQQMTVPPRRASLTIKTAPVAAATTNVTTTTTAASNPGNPVGNPVGNPAGNPVKPNATATVTVKPHPPTPSTVVAQLAEAAADLEESQHFYVEESEHFASVQLQSQRPTWSELLEKWDFETATTWIFAIIVAMVVCILTEDEISFVYTLAFISLGSIAAFVREELYHDAWSRMMIVSWLCIMIDDLVGTLRLWKLLLNFAWMRHLANEFGRQMGRKFVALLLISSFGIRPFWIDFRQNQDGCNSKSGDLDEKKTMKMHAVARWRATVNHQMTDAHF